MTWLKIGDEFLEDETIGALHDRTFRLHVKGLVYCARNNTDGHLSERAVKVLQALLGHPVRRNVVELVNAGLWIPVVEPATTSDGTVYSDGYAVKNFLKYNPSAAEVKKRRDDNSRKQALYRDVDLRLLVRERDQDQCRYCGVKVGWKDRRGALGGTYDHVDPWGPNSPENLVVACRGCNSGKGRRTPEQAGMRLLSAPPVSKTDLVTQQVSGSRPTRPDPKRTKGFSIEPPEDPDEKPWERFQLREIA